MNYLEKVAARVQALVPSSDLPGDDTTGLFLIYALLVLAKGEQTTSSDVHDAWSAWMAQRDPHHEALVPFEQLEADVRAEDTPYLEAIREVARQLHDESHER